LEYAIVEVGTFTEKVLFHFVKVVWLSPDEVDTDSLRGTVAEPVEITSTLVVFGDVLVAAVVQVSW
jgi:hypothetical protein